MYYVWTWTRCAAAQVWQRGLQLQGGADQTHRQEDEVAVQKLMGQSRGSLQTDSDIYSIAIDH